MAVLWERWCPEEPGFELLSEHIAQGYKSQEKKSPAAAADVWLRAWEDVLALARKLDTREMTAFDEAFGGYQSVFNWCQDIGHALDDAGRGDDVYPRKAIAYGESLLATFSDLDPLIAGNTRRSIAEAHFKLGEVERGNALFRAWLTDDPLWGWGWIGWSDCHAYRRDRHKDALLQENGYFVLRFLAEDVGKRLDLVLNAILRALARHSPSATNQTDVPCSRVDAMHV